MALGIDRYINILNLFSEQKSAWTVAEMSEALDIAASTLYRIVRELVAVNFLESTINSSYRLGSAFIEFEYKIRRTDPLIRSGRPVVYKVVSQLPFECTCQVSRLFGRTIMCVADSRSAENAIQLKSERGRPVPPLQGATSRVILSSLTARRRNKVLADITRIYGAPKNLPGSDQWIKIRKAGISVIEGEVDPNMVGIAAPIKCPEFGIDAALTLIVRARDFQNADQAALFTIVIEGAKTIERSIGMLNRHNGAAQAGDHAMHKL